MMEQFLETVPIDMRVWLVDQKPKTIDMAQLSDQYVALRKPVDPVSPKSLSSHNDSFSTVALSKPGNSTTTRPFHKGDNRNSQILSSVESHLLQRGLNVFRAQLFVVHIAK